MISNQHYVKNAHANFLSSLMTPSIKIFREAFNLSHDEQAKYAVLSSLTNKQRSTKESQLLKKVKQECLVISNQEF